MNELSKAQINKLGERLRKGEITEQNLRLLDQFRQSFADSYQEVVGKITNRPGLAPTGRLDKSNASILAKLRREGTRLTTMQDIAGCRIVVDNIQEQDSVVAAISKLFSIVSVVDRRTEPRHGYRAVHLIVKSTPQAVEVQIRTASQQLWAESSEKLADRVGQGLKYGIGNPELLEVLVAASHVVQQYEELEREVIETKDALTRLIGTAKLSPNVKERIPIIQAKLTEFEIAKNEFRLEIAEVLGSIVDLVPTTGK